MHYLIIQEHKVSAQQAKNTLTFTSSLVGLGFSLVGLGELGYATQTLTNIANVGSEFLLLSLLEDLMK